MKHVTLLFADMARRERVNLRHDYANPAYREADELHESDSG
jgi:hypothetical protein